MARRKALTPSEWREAFQFFVDSTTRDLGKPPCIALEEDEAGGAELVASVASQTKAINVLSGRGQIMVSGLEVITSRVYKSEIPIVLQLLRDYQQPEPGFDGNLPYWGAWIPAQDKKQTDLLGWG